MTTRRRPSSAKLQTIARQAGVSISTVSRVLNARANVSPRTRQVVQELLQAAGYEIKAVDRRSPQLIDLVVPNLWSPYMTELFRALDAEAARRGVSVVVANRNSGTNWLTSIANRRSRGVVLAVIGIDEREHAWLVDNEIRHVAIDPAVPPPAGTPWLVAEHEQAAGEAVRYLVSLGHRRIVYASSITVLANTEREAGYRQAMASAGLSATPTQRCDSSPGGAAELLRRIMAGTPAPTAILASHDDLALRLLAAAHEQAIAIPDRLSIIGFDGVVEGGRFRPPLTTMASPLSQMCRIAVDHVLDTTDAGDELTSGARFPMTLLARGTCGQPAMVG